MNYKVPKHILHSKLDDEIAILNLRNGEYYSLNDTGALIWSMICTGDSFDEILNSLTSEYDNENNEIKSDLFDLIDELKSNGLVQEI